MQVDGQLLTKVAEGVARGEYSLLLGAGASVGAMGGNGVPLPSGPELRDRIVSEFGVPVGVGGERVEVTLPRAYSYVAQRTPGDIASFMGSWFTGCKPAWQDIVADFQWRRIWTLNIDDVIETVYNNRGIHIDRFDHTSKFRDGRRRDNQIIHLHGYARKDTVSDLVFSIQEYMSNVRDPRAWHAVFVDEFTEQPFIVIGATLQTEFDLEPALRQSAADKTRGFPSVIVLKSVSPFERDELTRLGLAVIEADADEFMQTLKTEVAKFPAYFTGQYARAFSLSGVKFLQQFVDLRTYNPSNSDKFYSGYEPSWGDILSDDDARIEATANALNSIRSEMHGTNDSAQKVHMLTGYAGSGKSTGLLRIAQHFIAEGHHVFSFRGDEALDVDAAIDWLMHSPMTVLLFDNCADFAHSLRDLVSQCESSNTNLLAIGAERLNRRQVLEREIKPEILHIYEYKFLSDRDIESLLDKLSSRRRLGKITRESRARQQDYFRKTASRRLFEGMANLEGGAGFRQKIQDTYNQLDERTKRTYAAASIAYELGYSLPLGIATTIAGLPVNSLIDLAQEQSIFTVDTSGVHPPHRITASTSVEWAIPRGDKEDALYRLAHGLAPHIDVPAITNQSRPYRLVRRLMDQETVHRLIGAEPGRNFYANIQPLFDWNGRYWEQRALFESEVGNNEQARSYAEHSLVIHRHPFAFNTLGTILGRIAIATGDSNILRDALRNLLSARSFPNWEASEHPYQTFFSTMNRFGSSWGIASIPSSLRNDWTQWFRWAQLTFSNPKIHDQLRQYQSDWLHLAVG